MKEKIKINKYSKIILLSGSIITSMLIIASLFCHIFAGRLGDYYILHPLSLDLITSARQCVGVTIFGTIMFEIVNKKQ
ncbi:MAG: hypothetical protein IIX39_02450 [Clostridia bacterium]|nr:hypothetical protein [Clostridia bacterium]